MLPSHEDLVSELPKLGKLSATDRKQLNDNRRASQIDGWKEREFNGGNLNDVCTKRVTHPRKRKKLSHRPHFDPGLILLNCAALGDIDGVNKLLSQGVSPTVCNVDRITPLHQSCLENDETITEVLIEAGSDIDCLDNELWTPLHAAVSLANIECVKVLLQHNANQLSPNVDGQLPIDLCEDTLVLSVMEQDLLDKGITQNDMATARTSQETTFFKEVKQLLETGGNPNFQLLDNDATLLHVAAANGYVEVALYLLSKSCKVDIQDIDGWTALHAAAFWEEVDLIELLAAHGADFKLRTFCGELPADLTEDPDIRALLQRLSERSELMKKTGAVLRPSSVRGRLVSRMTTGEKEDKRRESAELHNFFVEQIERDLTKAPESWRIRTGKYVRPALRDINFDNIAVSDSKIPSIPGSETRIPFIPDSETKIPSESNLNIADKTPDSMSNAMVSQRPSLERSPTISDSSDYSYEESANQVLSAICENGEHALVRPTDSPSVDEQTFELMSPSTTTIDETIDEEKQLAMIEQQTPKDPPADTLVCANKATMMRKEKSFDNLSGDDLEQITGSATPVNSTLSRSTSLVHTKPKEGNVKRFYSFRSNMQETTPRFSPKPKNNKTAYKNRKKAGSSAGKHSSGDDDVLNSNSLYSSGDLDTSNLVTMPAEEDAKPPPQSNHKSSIPVTDSMVPNTGSLSSAVEPAVEAPEPSTAPMDEPEREKSKKSKKCCVIL